MHKECMSFHASQSDSIPIDVQFTNFACVIYINRLLCFAVCESKTNCIRGICEIRNMHDNNKMHVEKDWLNRSFFGMFSKKEEM